MIKNFELSAEYHQFATPRQCWQNCIGLIFTSDANWRYVEGFTIDWQLGFNFEHGWLELDGQIVDPTLPDGDLEYFPFARYDRNAIMRVIARTEFDNVRLPLCVHHVPNARDHYWKRSIEVLDVCFPGGKKMMLDNLKRMKERARV